MSKSKPQIKIRSARRTKECHYVDDLLASRVGRDLFHLACEDAEDELGVPCWRIPLARLAKHLAEEIEDSLAIRRVLKKKPYYGGLDAAEAAEQLLMGLLFECDDFYDDDE
jgi:hypothetical protein